MEEPKTTRPFVRILLGGGIGSGKSRAGGRFADLGAEVVEADRLGHAVLEPGGEAFGDVARRWPEALVDGGIDRAALSDIVFTDPVRLGELEAITHPAIIKRIEEAADRPGDLVVEVPLILNLPGPWVNVFIDAEEELRVRRAIVRGGTEQDVRRRMASQTARSTWLRWADRVIENSGSTDDLDRRIDSLWHDLQSGSGGPKL
jgi:dephospho-CoA kinase